ncbi:helix-turn-helix domain-containing protein [Nocardia veterana]|uniref:AraC family transcriptional regulator n=1 Tax=Nocardia veterana TaxID=132249 RepID=A0A7X6M1L9_9NOCA|nr:helix-turn-helix domain-containing protein [Nocardia veterana]NKY88616.1 AraC family transcriptional regulator [Nocardia veterana]
MTTMTRATVSTTDTAPVRAVVWLWPGQAAYFGPSFHLDTHSAAVHTLAVGIDASFAITLPGSATRRVRSVLVPARVRHRIESAGRMLFFYLDAQSGSAAGVRAAMRDRSSSVLAEHRATAPLIDHLSGPDAPNPAAIRRIILGGADVALVDYRVRRTMARLLADPGRAPTAAAAAEAVGLSESRFLHLFTAHAGTSYRRYRMWARLLRAGAAVAAGRDLTAAAADAGFASTSHFSDTFRAVFGLSATAVLARGTEIVVLER